MGMTHRCIRVVLCTALLAACSTKEKPSSTDSAAGTVDSSAMAPAAKPFALADVAGKWNVTSKPESGTDTTSTTYVLNATADTTGWTITFPGRKPMAVHVQLSGDSVITMAGPYDSVRRKGLKVTTNGAFKLQDGKLVGRTTAHFKTTKPDSVLTLANTGTRAP
jgi:hypothetical protein